MAHINIEILTALDIIVINGTQRDVNLHPHDITKTNKLSYIVFIFFGSDDPNKSASVTTLTAHM